MRYSQHDTEAEYEALDPIITTAYELDHRVKYGEKPNWEQQTNRWTTAQQAEDGKWYALECECFDYANAGVTLVDESEITFHEPEGI